MINPTEMANSTMLKATTCLILIVATMVVAPLLTEAAAPPPKISCGKVTSSLAPCFEYVLNGGKVPPNCCAGVKSLYKAASTTAERRNVCLCLKSVTTSASPAAIKNAKSLPGKCGIILAFKITPTIDCSKVN